MLPIIFSLKRVGRVGLVNKFYWDVTEKTTMFTTTKMFVQVFLHASYAMCMFTKVRSIIIPPAAKSVSCLTYILFSTFVKSNEINQAFLHAVKSMINFVKLIYDQVSPITVLVRLSVSLTYAQIRKLGVLQLKDPTDLSTRYNLALTK